MCVLREKMTGTSVSFPEEQEKNEKDGDFLSFLFLVGKTKARISSFRHSMEYNMDCGPIRAQ